MQFLDWKYIKEADIIQLEACVCQEEVNELLLKLFQLSNSNRARNTLETLFHLHNYSFCKEMGFSPRKTSTFMSIMKEILTIDSQQDPICNSPEISMSKFEAFLISHSVERPPKSVEIFNRADVKAIMNFALNRYYRNFHIYNYIFSFQISLQLRQVLRNSVDEPCVNLKSLNGAVMKDSEAVQPS